jgi:tetratricopeptide (TPR) repeat protein
MPEHNMTPTGFGAATGAVLGAGIGTLIGSTSGNAGEGLIFGSIAGAAAGGAVGRGFEGQDVAIEQQREKLYRHEDIIGNQQKEIEDLRKQLDDRFSQFNRPSSYSGDEYSVNEYQGTPRARMWSDQSEAYGAQPLAAATPQVVAKASPPKVAAREAATQVKSVPKRQAKPFVPDVQAKASVSAPKAPEPSFEVASRAKPQKSVMKLAPRPKTKPAPEFKTEFRSKNVSSLAPPAVPRARLKEIEAPVRKPAAAEKTIAKITPRSVSSPEVTPKPLKIVKESKEQAMDEVAKARSAVETNTAKAAKSTLNEVSRATASVGDTVSKTTADSVVAARVLPDEPGKIKDPGCQKAEKEAGRAEKATSAADRLFYFRRALRFCPSEPVYHMEIGKVYQSIGRNEDAEYEFQQALELDPNLAEARDLLAALN